VTRRAAFAVLDGIVAEEKNKPIRDEEALAKVLEAAYVMQERNREKKPPEKPKMALVPPSPKDPQAVGGSPASPAAAPPAQNTIPASRSASTSVLAQIVEIQQQIQIRHLQLEDAMSLAAERLTQVARASGAAIGVLEHENLRYRAATGVMAPPVGSEIPVEKALCASCFQTGVVFCCADVNIDRLIDKNECARRGIRSLIAVPVFRDGSVAGGLELYFPAPDAFTEEDVHTCQLVAGLVTEALARDEEVTWKKSIATERAVMLGALEKLRPNLAALVDTPATKEIEPIGVVPSLASFTPAFACRRCGHELVGQEQYCGNCGAPRRTDPASESPAEAPSLQSKVAALWHMQEAMKQTSPVPPVGAEAIPESMQRSLDNVDGDVYADLDDGVDHEESFAKPPTGSIPGSARVPELFASEARLRGQTPPSTERRETAVTADFESSTSTDLEIPLADIPADLPAPEAAALTKAPDSTQPQQAATWSSAATTLDFLEQLAGVRNPGAWAEFWSRRRGDIYLAIAVVLVLAVIRWGIWSNHSVAATANPAVSAGHHKAAPDADLPLFDRILIKLGLAEAPDPPEYRGNPRTQVWVDLHTALYYCPGSDLYGKTPKGRFSSQREAQLDQFEPAYRKACD
jgi:putative methionine-R-sulfoxide reductase with GAF domain